MILIMLNLREEEGLICNVHRSLENLDKIYYDAAFCPVLLNSFYFAAFLIIGLMTGNDFLFENGF